jgi:hypothetical protein
VEADLLHIWPDLPEDWRARRVPSFRRLLVIVRHLPPGSAIARLDREGAPEWTLEAELLDAIRRGALAIAAAQAGKQRPFPAPHRHSPEHRWATARAEDLELRRERARARDAARQERLARRRDQGGLHR